MPKKSSEAALSSQQEEGGQALKPVVIFLTGMEETRHLSEPRGSMSRQLWTFDPPPSCPLSSQAGPGLSATRLGGRYWRGGCASRASWWPASTTATTQRCGAVGSRVEEEGGSAGMPPLLAHPAVRFIPQAVAPQMAEDVNTGIAWVLKNIGAYTGDPGHVTLVGQSAGAHLGCLTLLRQCERAAAAAASSSSDADQDTPTPTSTLEDGPAADGLSDSRPSEASGSVCALPTWSPGDIRAFVGISGVYDLQGLSDHLRKRGMAS